MITPVEPTNFLTRAKSCRVIDVRSPGEFTQGHIPGAFNIPVFDDDARAAVGTLYVQKGREDAILKGLDLALPKAGFYLESLDSLVSSPREILLHCWRGGLRSTLMAEMFSTAGYEVFLLTGGYKAYRRFIREELGRQARIIVLGGYTGSGKTELLQAVASRGEQVVDLEGLASHKGSAFGALGQPQQPTNEQFENNLYACWSELDLSRRVWVEDESRMIGRVTLPDPVVEQITSGMLIKIDLDKEIRIGRLVTEYAGFDENLLSDSIHRIAERLGGTNARDAITALANKQFDAVARIVLGYYDKAYLFSIDRRKNKEIHDILIPDGDMEANAGRIIALADKYQ